ncbi:MAG: hypothetical protein WCT51_01930 [Candidatus Shapirobacteria bacterium]
MLQNHIYNLMAQMVQENKSLWRIKNKYLADSTDCPECQLFFTKLTEKKEATIAELLMLIKSEINK